MKIFAETAAGARAARSLFEAAARHFLMLTLAYISSRAKIAGDMLPFGVAVSAAAPAELLPSALTGAVLGYLLPSVGSDCFRYTAACAAAAAVKLAVAYLCRLKKHDGFIFVSTALLLFLTAAVTRGSGLLSLMLCAAEGLLGGAAALLSSRTLTVKASAGGMTSYERTATAVTACIICMGLYDLRLGLLSLGCTASALLLALAAEQGGASAGALVGALMGAAAYLSAGESLPTLAFTLAGIAGGLVSPMGKYAVVSAMTAVAAVTAALSGFGAASAELFTSFISGCIIYAVLPSRAIFPLCSFLKSVPIADRSAGIQQAVADRLSSASEALVTVGSMISDVSDRLSAAEAPRLDSVSEAILRRACEGCGYLSLCWERDKAATEAQIYSLTADFGSFADAAPLLHRCPRRERLEAAARDAYGEYKRQLEEDSRLREIREAIKNEYLALSELLKEFSEETAACQSCCDQLSAELSEAVSSLGVRPSRLSCITDRLGRMRIELALPIARGMPVGRARLRGLAESVTMRAFDIPEVVRGGSNYLITMTEKAKFEPEIGIFRITEEGSEASGDTADSFSDGRGRRYLVLSDGMGSGRQAASASSMAGGLFCRMICSGFGAECSLQLINSALMYRSRSEAFTTLDVTEIDLYSGKALMLKAGTAPTFVLKNGHASKASCSSLPIGILKTASFARAATELKKGDILLMLSDGALSEGCDWICRELEKYSGEGAARLCERIARQAQSLRSDGHSDDITVMAAIMTEAV